MNPSVDDKDATENAPKTPTPESAATGNDVNVQQEATASSQSTEPTQGQAEQDGTASPPAPPSKEQPAVATGNNVNVGQQLSGSNPQAQADHQRTARSTAPPSKEQPAEATGNNVNVEQQPSASNPQGHFDHQRTANSTSSRNPSDEQPASSCVVQVQEGGSPQGSSPGVHQVRPLDQGAPANRHPPSSLRRTRDDDSDDEDNELREVLARPAVNRSVRNASRGFRLLNALYNNAWMVLLWSGERLLWFVASLLYWPLIFLARRRR